MKNGFGEERIDLDLDTTDQYVCPGDQFDNNVEVDRDEIIERLDIEAEMQQ